MLVVADFSKLPHGDRALAIGTFDGVHVGHRRVIGAAVDTARRRGLIATVLTFDPHPLSVIDPAHEPRLLTPFAVKAELIAELDVDEIVVLAFDRRMADLEAEGFCALVLDDRLAARVVVVGRNFTFAAGGKGTPASLRACGRSGGFETIVVPLARAGGRPISSTRIRRLLTDGELGEAREILGRPPRTLGRVVRGFRRGTQIGYPTANIEAETGTMFPGRGVYAARAQVRGRWYRAAVNVGHNPTFVHHGDETGVAHIEAYLLEFAGDIYDEPIRVDFLTRIRPEQAFEYVDDLVDRLRVDIAETAALDDTAYLEVGL